MESLKDDNGCFVCGNNNPIGLKLLFKTNGKTSMSRIVFSENYEGWKGMIHGGILSTVLDEVMIKSANNEGFTCVTAELKIRYRKPCLTGEEYRLEGSVSEVKRNLVFTKGKIINTKGETIASSTGKLFVVDPANNTIR